MLWFVIVRTRAGMLVRAAASNEPMARALGIDTKRVFAAVFAAGSVLAGLAGLMVAPITGTSVGMGDQVVILAFVVIIVGGVGSVRGAFIAALGVGLIDTLGRAYLPDLLARGVSLNVASAAGPALASILIYITMAVVLVLRPAGIVPAVEPLGSRAWRRPRLSPLAGRLQTRQSRVARRGDHAPLLLVLSGAGAADRRAAFGGGFWLDVLNRVMINAIAAASLALLVSQGGLISLGHAAYFGIGSYSVGIAASNGIDNGFVQLALARRARRGRSRSSSGLVVLRTRGVHFIMVTLAFGQMVYFVMIGLKGYGGDDGLTIDSRSSFPVHRLREGARLLLRDARPCSC